MTVNEAIAALFDFHDAQILGERSEDGRYLMLWVCPAEVGGKTLTEEERERWTRQNLPPRHILRLNGEGKVELH